MVVAEEGHAHDAALAHSFQQGQGMQYLYHLVSGHQHQTSLLRAAVDK
tara:strand:+ start:785 stop:928 length:144 start_codon:yes stop_codon:yes gene_type:complete